MYENYIFFFKPFSFYFCTDHTRLSCLNLFTIQYHSCQIRTFLIHRVCIFVLFSQENTSKLGFWKVKQAWVGHLSSELFCILSIQKSTQKGNLWTAFYSLRYNWTNWYKNEFVQFFLLLFIILKSQVFYFIVSASEWSG